MIKITDQFVDKFENLVADEMADIKVSGAAITIVKDGEIIYEQGFGARDLSKELPANKDTLFAIASATKSFVSLAIMQLQEQGKLDVNDPVSKYVPLKLGSNDNPITIHHLMTHSSGMPDFSGHTYTYIEDSRNIPILPHEKMIPFTSKDDFYRHLNGGGEFLVPPGEHFYYNNFAYSILSDIVERVAEVPFLDYMQKHIFEPLNMERTTFDAKKAVDDDNFAQGYLLLPPKEGEGSAPKPVDYVTDRWSMYAPGGLFSTVRELANYVIMHLNGGEFEGRHIIGTKSIEQIQSPHLKSGTFGQRYISEQSQSRNRNYGYGFFVDSDFHGYKMIDHGGNTIGGTADLLFLPENKLGIISLANNLMGPRPIINAGLAMLLGKDPEEEIPFLVSRNHYRKLMGTYQTYKGGNKKKLVRKGSYLTIENFHPDPSMPHGMTLVPQDDSLNPMEFYMPLSDGTKFIVLFDEDSDGHIWMNFDRNRYKKVQDHMF